MGNDTGQDRPQEGQDVQLIGAQGAPQPGHGTVYGSMTPEQVEAKFKQYRDEAQGYRQQLEAMQKAQADAEKTRLEEKQQYKELYEKAKADLEALQPIKDKAAASDDVIAKLLESQLQQLPEEAREMVNTMPGDSMAKLNWLADNQARLIRPPAPQMDAGARGDPPPKDRKLTPEQEDILRRSGMPREKYLAALGIIEGE